MTDDATPAAPPESLLGPLSTPGGSDERDAAIGALEEAERRYRQLVETIPAVVWLDRIDDESSNIYMSPQDEPMLGYPLSAWEEDRTF